MEEAKSALQSVSSLQAKAACPDRYEILGLIGQGGMGMVLRAVDKELSRDVAIKILSFDVDGEPEAQERFLREAKTLAGLNHPNIVSIFTSGLNAHGNPYNVMEFLEGISLADELEKGPLDESRFFELFKQILAGLEYAHQNKIVHRDLKPSNIMHCKDGAGNDLYKLVDFGIARADSSAEGVGKTITRTDAILGSPAYISPEQCRGVRADFRSDIYSLGCIMYECISGKQLFQAETALEIMYKHMTAAPLKLSAGKISPASMEIALLVDQCLEKEPDLRPKSAAEIIDRLHKIQSQSAAKFDIFSRQVSTANKRTLPVLKILVFVVSLIAIGTFVGLVLQNSKKPASSKAFLAANKQEVLEHDIAKAQEKVDAWTKPAGAGTEAEIECRIHFKDLFDLGRLQLKSTRKKDIVAAEKTYLNALDLCKNFHGDLSNSKAACWTLIAKSLLKQGKLDESKQYFDKAVKVATPDDHPTRFYFDVILERDILLVRTGHFDEVSDDIRDLRASLQVAPDAPLPEQLDSVDGASQVLDKKGEDRFILVSNILAELLTVKPKTQKDTVAAVKLLNSIGEALLSVNIPGKPTQALERSMELLDSIKGEDELKNITKQKYAMTMRAP